MKEYHISGNFRTPFDGDYNLKFSTCEMRVHSILTCTNCPVECAFWQHHLCWNARASVRHPVWSRQKMPGASMLSYVQQASFCKAPIRKILCVAWRDQSISSESLFVPKAWERMYYRIVKVPLSLEGRPIDQSRGFRLLQPGQRNQSCLWRRDHIVSYNSPSNCCVHSKVQGP